MEKAHPAEHVSLVDSDSSLLEPPHFRLLYDEDMTRLLVDWQTGVGFDDTNDDTDGFERRLWHLDDDNQESKDDDNQESKDDDNQENNQDKDELLAALPGLVCSSSQSSMDSSSTAGDAPHATSVDSGTRATTSKSTCTLSPPLSKCCPLLKTLDDLSIKLYDDDDDDDVHLHHTQLDYLGSTKQQQQQQDDHHEHHHNKRKSSSPLSLVALSMASSWSVPSPGSSSCCSREVAAKKCKYTQSSLSCPTWSTLALSALPTNDIVDNDKTVVQCLTKRTMPELRISPQDDPVMAHLVQQLRSLQQEFRLVQEQLEQEEQCTTTTTTAVDAAAAAANNNDNNKQTVVSS